jgi:hypothetical protein
MRQAHRNFVSASNLNALFSTMKFKKNLFNSISGISIALKTIIGVTAALILFASLFTNCISAESSSQNKTKTEGTKELSREEKAAQVALKYPLYKDPHKVDKPPVYKVQAKTKFNTPDGVKLLTKGQGVPKKAKTGIKKA